MTYIEDDQVPSTSVSPDVPIEDAFTPADATADATASDATASDATGATVTGATATDATATGATATADATGATTDAAEITECPICCNAINKYIACMYCKAKICSKCFHKYIMMETVDQKCMYCNAELPLDFILLHSNKVSRHQYFTKLAAKTIAQQTLLVHTTKSLLHYTKLQRELRAKLDSYRSNPPHNNMISDVMFVNNKYIEYINLVRATLDLRPTDTEHIERELEAIAPIITELYRADGYARTNDDDDNNDVLLPVQLVCIKEQCTGVIAEDKCTECEMMICRKCYCERTSDHKCDPIMLESIAFLKKDTKPCPKCSTPIHKIDGCDQMFCTQCHVAFSWNRGVIEKGTIHNPHYFEWQRSQRARLDGPADQVYDPCGDLYEQAVQWLIRNKINDTIPTKYKLLKTQIASCRTVTNNITVALDRMRRNVHDVNIINYKHQTLRHDYCNNKITKKSWHNSIRLNLKYRELQRELILLLEMYLQSVHDILVNMHQTVLLKGSIDYAALWQYGEDVLTQLIPYFENQLVEIEHRHGLKTRTKLEYPHIKCNWIN